MTISTPNTIPTEALKRFEKAHPVPTDDNNVRWILGLSLLREMARKNGHVEYIEIIEAMCSSDPDALLRVRIGDQQLTPKQWEALKFINDYTHQNDCSPTIREVAAAMDISVAPAFERVQSLIKKHVLVNNGAHWRGLKIVDRS